MGSCDDRGFDQVGSRVHQSTYWFDSRRLTTHANALSSSDMHSKSNSQIVKVRQLVTLAMLE